MDTDSTSEGNYFVVPDLARALLQIGRGIDPKYLNPPLGMFIQVLSTNEFKWTVYINNLPHFHTYTVYVDHIIRLVTHDVEMCR